MVAWYGMVAWQVIRSHLVDLYTCTNFLLQIEFISYVL